MTPIIVRALCQRDYLDTLTAMRDFTHQRDAHTADEIWLIEHPPVFTQGLAGKAEHLLDPGDIPVVATERGGQVTYHGPGQVLAYLMLNLRRRDLAVRELVRRMEHGIIRCLSEQKIDAARQAGAPGVYLSAPEPLAGSKIASLGLKVSRGCSFHGLALNVAMDLSPFKRINPCGYADLNVTDMRSVIGPTDIDQIAVRLAESLVRAIDAPRPVS